MGKKIVKEIGIFLSVVIVLAFIQHSDLATHPMARIESMIAVGNYLHPFLWSIVPYLLLAGLRLAIAFVLKSISSKKEN
jgi:hypothetical protein